MDVRWIISTGGYIYTVYDPGSVRRFGGSRRAWREREKEDGERRERDNSKQTPPTSHWSAARRRAPRRPLLFLTPTSPPACSQSCQTFKRHVGNTPPSFSHSLRFPLCFSLLRSFCSSFIDSGISRDVYDSIEPEKLAHRGEIFVGLFQWDKCRDVGSQVHVRVFAAEIGKWRSTHENEIENGTINGVWTVSCQNVPWSVATREEKIGRSSLTSGSRWFPSRARES